MAPDNHPLTLMNIPLEVRHQIFQYVALRDTQPKKLLRYWFEKKEVKEKTAQLAAQDPSGVAPVVVFAGDQYEYEEEYEDDSSEDDEEGEEDSDAEEGEEEEDEEDEDEEGDESESDSDEDEDQEDEEDIDEEEVDEDEVDAEDQDAEIDSTVAHTVTGAAKPPPRPPVITAHSKWRHIPQFMRMTHCPPPVELLLACKQLNNEAKGWFYDVAVLRIEATGSFAHTSFFEEAFSQITEAAFSPMEDIRKAETTFVWDTTWLRSDEAGCAGAIFPALLRQRAAFVVNILAQAPNLRDVIIHWHDSARDDESIDLMNDVLMGFLGLRARVKIVPHYIAVDAKPYRKSIAGRRRIEFQNIVDIGLDRLF
ncbi:hypothetical protein EKO04_007789 [Ascochyta lentis]|uniref:Uncharacterized protein n=1 Tax=Ascochyta lentis TaxID=205686 RepID=A0A8H7J0F0_9PLEO|nr:hypothetical protein EKO04_007789 [Ascochyta lentis]